MSQTVFIRRSLQTLNSSRLLEVHADGGLGHLQVGQTAEVLRDERQRHGGVRPEKNLDQVRPVRGQDLSESIRV